MFRERFDRPLFGQPGEKDCQVQLKYTKVPASFIRLVPQEVNEDTVLPRNSPEIALKELKTMKKRNIKPSSRIEVTIKS